MPIWWKLCSGCRLYVEYSGTFGEEKKVRAIRRKLKQTRLFYGGGITNEEQAKHPLARLIPLSWVMWFTPMWKKRFKP